MFKILKSLFFSLIPNIKPTNPIKGQINKVAIPVGIKLMNFSNNSCGKKQITIENANPTKNKYLHFIVIVDQQVFQSKWSWGFRYHKHY